MEFFVVIYLCSIFAAGYIFAEDYFKRRRSENRELTRKEIAGFLTFTFMPVVNSVFVLSFIIAG